MDTINQQLNELKLAGIKSALQRQLEQPNLYNEQSFEERLNLLLTSEIDARNERKISRLIKQAKFRLGASISDLTITKERNIDPKRRANLFLL